MFLDREVYEHGNVRLLVDNMSNQENNYWLEVGHMSLQLKSEEVESAALLLTELVKEIDNG